MPFSRSLLCILLLLPLTALTNELDQESAEITSKESRFISRWWINLGAGVGGSSNGEIRGPAANFSLNGNLTPRLFFSLYSSGVRSTDDVEGKFRSGDIANLDYKGSNDVGVLLGYIHRQPKGFWAISSGICRYVFEEVDSYQGVTINSYYTRTYINRKSSVGLPLQAQAFWTPFRHFGVGVIGHSVVVPKPYAAIMLAIQVT